jgi:hypothetical protein
MEVIGKFQAPAELSLGYSFGMHCVGGQVSPRAGLEAVEERRSPVLRMELRFLGHPAPILFENVKVNLSL